MRNKLWSTLPVTFVLITLFIAGGAGCSVPIDTSPSSTTITPEPGPAKPTPTPETEPISEEIPGWIQSSRDLDGVPGTVYALKDGDWVEVTVGSVIGQAYRTENGWYWPSTRTRSYGSSDEFASVYVHKSINQETGEIYIAEIEWKSAAERKAELDAIIEGGETPQPPAYTPEPVPLPTPTPHPPGSVWLTRIDISPSSPESIGIGGTLQFTATGTYSDGSTADITSQVFWDSMISNHATVSTTGLATGVWGGITNIIAIMDGISARVRLEVLDPYK